MKLLRRLSYAALAFGFLHIVFGAIVRISGSGLGCGDHWPKCHGWWIPPLRRMDLIIEVSHRYLAAGLSTAVLLLLAGALLERREPGVSGRGGVLRPAVLATVLVFTAALLGAVVVKLELHNKYIIVLHLAIAMSLLATVAVATIRAGGLGSLAVLPSGASAKTFRSGASAAGLAFVAVAFGGLTANVVGANGACQGFPTCSAGVLTHGTPLYVHVVHRVLAFLLLFHTLGLAIGVTRRGESLLIRRAARIVFGTVVLQIVVAAMLVELHLPAPLRSLHEAVGTLVWLTAFVFAVLARRASVDGDPALLEPARPTAPARPFGRTVAATSSDAAPAFASVTVASSNGVTAEAAHDESAVVAAMATEATQVLDAPTDLPIHARTENVETTSESIAVAEETPAHVAELEQIPQLEIAAALESVAEVDDDLDAADDVDEIEPVFAEPAIVGLAAVAPDVALDAELIAAAAPVVHVVHVEECEPVAAIEQPDTVQTSASLDRPTLEPVAAQPIPEPTAEAVDVVQPAVEIDAEPPFALESEPEVDATIEAPADEPVEAEPWAAAPFVADLAGDDDAEDELPDEGVLVARGESAAPPRAYSALLEPPSLEEIDADEALHDAPWLAAAFELDVAEFEVEPRTETLVLRPIAPAAQAAGRAESARPETVVAEPVTTVADAAARRVRRPPTLAVLIARGADF